MGRLSASASLVTFACDGAGLAAAPGLSDQPLFLVGSLGSLLDILLTLALGLLFSVVVGLVIGGHWLNELRHTSQGLGWDMLTGGLVVGGGAASFWAVASALTGVQIILMLVLPALGWGGMAVAVTGRPPRQAVENRLALGSLAGLVAALMLLFTDSDGIFLGAMDGILRWSFQAAFFSLWAALLAGFLLLLLRKRLVAVGNAVPSPSLLSSPSPSALVSTCGWDNLDCMATACLSFLKIRQMSAPPPRWKITTLAANLFTTRSPVTPPQPRLIYARHWIDWALLTDRTTSSMRWKCVAVCCTGSGSVRARK
ncbi:MAG: hypothetical protein M5U34_03520 [Chloroflexi bacterium]|nr:hypothetical protein [Chloroflexota bacterium]